MRNFIIKCNHFNVQKEVLIERPESSIKTERGGLLNLKKKVVKLPWRYEFQEGDGKFITTNRDFVRAFRKDGLSCRFYALEQDSLGRNSGHRVKVHVDGPVDFDKVAAEFKEKGVDASVADLKEAYGK